MKTQSEQIQRWDDIIFEKRNKEYGAYAIRKNYNSNVLKAEAISLGIGLLIFILPILLRDEKISLPIISKPDDGIILEPVGKIEPIITPPAPVNPPARIDASIIPTQVTTALVPDEPVVQPTTDAVAFTTGPDTGTPSPDPGTLTTGAGVDTEPVVEAPKVFEFVEKMPEYEGGYEAMMKFLQRKTRYPAIAIRKKDEGTVYVSFVVSPDGSVTHVQIVKGISKECDAEAMRVISLMDKWKAGIQNGMPVSVKKVLPITFRLEQ